MNKRATITDVAKKAGVSVATVSRYFSNNGYPVSKEAGLRIDYAASTLEYTPNIVGRMLKTNTSLDIGVIIPTIMNPFYPDVLLGIEKTAARRGYQILLCNSLRNSETETRYIDSLYQKQVRGIIIASTEGSEDKFKKMKSKGMVVVNLEGGGNNDCCSGVEFNFKEGAKLLADHLKNFGHDKIAFLTSPFTKQSRRDILIGINNVYGEENILVLTDDDETESEGGIYEYEMGRRLAEKLLEYNNCPKAVIAVNDITAAGVIKGLNEAGYSVPTDFSVAGFDNIELSAMITPALTTVNQPGFATGESAANILIDQIENKENKYSVIEPELIIRASTMKKEENNEF
ncbi:MAG: LacI family DNA-binding transcriptional regulator [Clostridiales bacterium]|nr:LacI family DNA-binding transcriptional regulator [Clostridiales bacterium]